MRATVTPITPSVDPNQPLVEIRDLTKSFPVKGGFLRRTVAEVRAVDGVNLRIQRGETLGLVGESGCGKTTIGRLILRLIDPTSGTITFDGTDISNRSSGELKPFRRRMQIIFQDPFASLDPRAPIGDSIVDGLRIHNVGDHGRATAPAAAHHGSGRPGAHTRRRATRTSSRAASGSASALPAR